MGISILTTKLFIPSARPQLVDRPRLLDRLDAARASGCRALLVCAPAGSGKTIVIVQWLARLAWPTAWLSLDERDNQPARFFTYLIAALQAVAPGAGQAAGALLELPAFDLEEVVTLLVNDLSAAPGPFILVLDDCHTLTGPVLLRALDFLLEAQPPGMRLLLLSREDPPLQLARRRARGQLIELRQADLRFTPAEAAAFLNHSMGLDISPAQVDALEARTEGWIAGLQMAAISLQSQPDPERFIREFSGSHRFILDYLMEEVLARQPQPVQEFLLHTAILERLCAGLCAAVIDPDPSTSQGTSGETGVQPAQHMLDYLAKANLFTIPLDEERHWYRYHHLFGDLLRMHLHAQRPGLVAPLHRRAAAWYETSGDPRLAVEHALQAQDFQLAADLVERHMLERWQNADMDFLQLASRLPQAVVASRPSLCLYSAWMGVILGQTGRILPLVTAAERALDAAGDASLPAAVSQRAFARTLRAYLADLANQPVQLDDGVPRALDLIPEEAAGMRNSVAVVLGTLYFMENDFAAAQRFFEAAVDLDKRLGGTNAVPIATARLARLLQVQGRLGAALQLLQENEAYVRERGIRRFYVAGSLNLQVGEILLELNQLEAAEEQIRTGLRLLEDWRVPQTLGLGLGFLARVQIARADLPAARESLSRLAALIPLVELHPEFSYAAQRAQVLLWEAEGSLPALAAWAAANPLDAFPAFTFRNEPRHVLLARAWLALGRRADAAALLESLDRSAQSGGRTGSRLEILALLAVAQAGLSDLPATPVNPSGAEIATFPAALESALRLAAPEGCLRSFLNHGQPMRRLLIHWLERSSAPQDEPLRAHARRLLAAFGGSSSPAPLSPAAGSPGIVEPLSARELEVLRLVAQGLTNQQIAARLVISLRTVKKHVENINGKLSTQNRTQAVARAREAGLC
jgi:LuxR family transcriptional regulator, maltose regulon positive regulatory protein